MSTSFRVPLDTDREIRMVKRLLTRFEQSVAEMSRLERERQATNTRLQESFLEACELAMESDASITPERIDTLLQGGTVQLRLEEGDRRLVIAFDGVTEQRPPEDA